MFNKSHFINSCIFLFKLSLVLSLVCFNNTFSASFNLGTTYVGNFKGQDTGENYSNLSTSMGVTSKFGDVTVSASSSVSRDLNDQYADVLFGDLRVNGSIGHRVLPKLEGSSSVFLVLPTSKNSRDFKNLNSSLGHTLSIPYKLNDSFGLNFTLTNIYHFYKYATDIFGRSNTRNQHAVGASANYSVSEKLGLFGSLRSTKSFTHSNVGSDSYNLGIGLNTSIRKFNLTMGYEINDNLLMPNGIERNFQVFDLDKSYFYLNLGVRF